MRLEIRQVRKEQVANTESGPSLLMFSFVRVTEGTEEAALARCQDDLVAIFNFEEGSLVEGSLVSLGNSDACTPYLKHSVRYPRNRCEE